MHAEADRMGEIRAIHQQYPFFYQVLLGIILVLIGVLIGGALFANDTGYQTNLYTELISIGITVFILDVLAKRRAENQYKQQLIDNAASTSNETAKNAVYQMRRHGWLEGDQGLLKGTDLELANLSGALMGGANLQGANLSGAYLEGIKLGGANLQGANLSGTHLEDAFFDGAQLQRADLSGAHLQGARLRAANLQGADLSGAHLQGANLFLASMARAELAGTEFDENTVLPDSSCNPKTDEYSLKWTPDTDMRRYTEPRRLNLFWQPEWARKGKQGPDQ